MENERVNVSCSFTCQRCLQPVIVDDSFSNMDDYAKAELDRKYYSVLCAFDMYAQAMLSS